MCTKCCAYEGASPFVRKCGSAAGARREGGAKGNVCTAFGIPFVS